jgi:hypothetical protein
VGVKLKLGGFMTNGEKFGPTPEELGLEKAEALKPEDNIEVEELKIEAMENQPQQSIMEKIRTLAKKPTAKIGMATLGALMILSLYTQRARAKELKAEIATGPGITEKTKTEIMNLEKEMALQEMIVNIQNEGYLQNAEIVDYFIDVEEKNVKIQGRVKGDLEGLKEIIKIDKKSPFYPEYQEKLDEIRKNYESRFPTLAQRKAVAGRAGELIMQQLLLQTLLFTKIYYEAERNPDDKNLQQQKQIVQSSLLKTYLGAAANNELAK